MKRTVENRVKAGATGGIEAVVKAVSTYISNANICFAGCGTLYGMTSNNGKALIKKQIMNKVSNMNG